MTYFACVLARTGDRWNAAEIALDGCDNLGDVADLARDVDGDLRLVLVEQDDEYAAIVRVDGEDDDPRAFLSDGHAADAYTLAAMFAAELLAVGPDGAEAEDQESGLEDILDDAPPVHESAPCGDADIAEDLGTPAAELLAMCAHEGTLPVDLLAAVCEKAGSGETFDQLRA